MIKKVLILGNGNSRLEYKDYIKIWNGEIWACNDAYTELTDFPCLNVMASVHQDTAEKIAIFRNNNNLNFRVLARYENNEIRIEKFKDFIGWTTGTELINQAHLENYDEIYLLGFDMGGKDIYPSADGKYFWVVDENVKKQMQQIVDKWGTDKIKVVYSFANEFLKNIGLTILEEQK